MSRIPAVDPGKAQGKQQELLAAVQKKMGKTPNLTRVLANSPAALEAYLGFSSALAGGQLDARVREQIALTTAEANGCDYCLSAHAAIGGMVGLTADQIAAARSARAEDQKTAAVLALARTLVVSRGHLTDAELAAARAAGISDGEVIEITATVVLNILTNYVNHVADTVIDFPRVAAAVSS